jgi:hypothetical protein
MADIVETSDQWFQLYRAHLFLDSPRTSFPVDGRRTDYREPSSHWTREYSSGDDGQCVSSP